MVVRIIIISFFLGQILFYIVASCIRDNRRNHDDTFTSLPTIDDVKPKKKENKLEKYT